jgi:surfactin family lipopeptide synthetase A
MRRTSISSIVSSAGPGPDLSPDQRRWWFLQSLRNDAEQFVVVLKCHLRGDVDARRLRDAVAALLGIHDFLRLAVDDRDGEPVASIHPFDVDELFSSFSDPGLARAFFERPAMAAGQPLLRIALVRISPEQSELEIVAHRLIADRSTLLHILVALASFYNGKRPQAAMPPGPASRVHSKDDCIAWWQDALRAPPVVELPTDGLRPPEQSVRREFHTFRLPDAVTDSLSRFSNYQRAIEEAVLVTATAGLLARFAHAEDLILGFTGQKETSGPEALGTGARDTLLPLCLAAEPDTSFAAMLERVQAAIREARNHALPFAELLDALDVPRNLSRAPLVQVAVSCADRGTGPLRFGDAEAQAARPFEPAQFLDLHFDFLRSGDTILGCIEYDPVLFTAESIECLPGYFCSMLGNALDHPSTRLSDLPMMTLAEQRRLLDRWNDTDAALPEEACVHRLFEAQVARTPDRVAAVSRAESLSYAELNRRANRLAHFLIEQGVRPGDLVGVLMDRTVDMLVSVLGVLKSGAGYVPLDPNFPTDRLALIAEDAGIRTMISHTRLQAREPRHTARKFRLDMLGEALARQPETNPEIAARPGDLFDVIFTSGSTGRPKGVMVEHRSVVNFLHSMQKTPGIAPDDVVLAVTTLSFDIAILELFLPLTCGARVVIADFYDAHDGNRIQGLIASHGVTFLQATPATWRMLIDAGWQGTRGLKALCGGETMSADLAHELLSRTASLWNMYGPTETTVWSTLQRIEHADDATSVGRPIDNTRIYVLDPGGNPAPPGIPGELVIGGAGVARGYKDRPDLDREKFVPDPFFGEEGERMYRTGDLARFLPDGRLQLYGRLDHQVKIRGYRIELGEIETLLNRHPDLARSVVVASDRPGGERILVAYYVPRANGDAVTGAGMRAYLAAHLPHYMVPNVFIPLDALPLTPNGKTDRNALPPVDDSLLGSEREMVGPRNPVEARLVEIWSEALGQSEIGVTDNFFDLGGHSLQAIRIFQRIERAFGQSLPLSVLFQTPTVAEFAAMLVGGCTVANEARHPAIVPVKPSGTQPPIFCVGGGVINLHNLAMQLGPDQPFYALQWQGLDIGMAMNGTLTEIAGIFIDAIRTIQPTGPYWLAGSFTAGMVAVEIARVLEERGEKVAFLAGFDAVILENTSTTVAPEVVERRRQKSFLRRVAGRLRAGPTGIRDYLLDPIHRERALNWVWRAGVAYSQMRGRPIPTWLRTARFEEYFILHATNRHRPEQRYGGTFDLFLTPVHFANYSPIPKFGWADWVAGDVRASMTPGGPCFIMLPPNVEELAHLLRTRMQEARTPFEARASHEPDESVEA